MSQQTFCRYSMALAGVGLMMVLRISAQPADPRDPIVAKLRDNNRPLAARLWDDIPSGQERLAMANDMAAELTGAAAGGGTIADFTPLIDLITSTIDPTSWDTNGGDGTMQPFPAGVFVNADGCLQQETIHVSQRLRETLKHGGASSDTSRVVASKTRLRTISLPRLERVWLRKVLAGDAIPAEIYHLAGLQRVEYVSVDEETGDLLLTGPASDEGPSLTLDALIGVLHNAWYGTGRFGCSIDPRANGLAAAQAFIQQTSRSPIPAGRRLAWSESLRTALGRQDVKVHGLDPGCHAARMIVAADYHMKLIGMGLEDGRPDVPSYLSLVELGPDGQAPPMDLLRWWFTLDYDRVETDPSRSVFHWQGRAARVLCENEFLNEQGERVHTGAADPKNQEFTQTFTRHLPALATRFRVYRQLQGVFDLAMAAAIIRREGLADRVAWHPSALAHSPAPTSRGAPVVKEVETTVQVRELSSRVFVTGVSGGVEVDPTPVLDQMVITDDSELTIAREAARPAEPYESDPRWWWDVSGKPKE